MGKARNLGSGGDKMNLQWGDKGIGWTDATWNPITGCKSTSEQCAVRDVCYARGISERFGRSFEPTFHPERLEEPYKLKKPAKIFVCSMGELFGPWVWRSRKNKVLRVAEENPQHTFQFLTKFPPAPTEFRFPPNAWLGVTVNDKHDTGRIQALNEIKYAHRFFGEDLITFVSAEPLLGALYVAPWHDIDWLIIGAQTNPDKQPKDEWIEALLVEADHYGFPVFMKSNLDYEPKRREFPKGVAVMKGGQR